MIPVGQMKLNLGCGKRYMPGWVNLDQSPAVKTDILGTVEHGALASIDPESVLAINARAYLAHIPRPHLPRVMAECYNILVPGGSMFLMVPYAGSAAYYSDPTHQTGFTVETLKHFTSWATDRPDADYGWPCRFVIEWLYVDPAGQFLSAWLGKHPTPTAYHAYDADIVATKLYPNGYMAHHAQTD